MFNLYLDPEDLINLLAEDESLSPDQHYFQTNYYKGILTIHKKQESCLALAALSALTGNYSESVNHLSLLTDFESPLVEHLFNFLSGLVKEKLNQFEDSQKNLIQAQGTLSLIKLKKPFLLELCLFNSFFLTRSYKKALELNLKIWELPENIKQAYFLKHAYCNEVLGHYEKALKNYSAAADSQGELSQVSLTWLKSLQGEDVSEDFENFLSQELKTRKKNDLILLYSLYLIKSGNYQKVKQLLEPLEHPDLRPETYSALACVYFKTAQIAKAFVYTLKYLKILPTQADGWVNLGVIYLKTHQDHRLKCLEKVKKFVKDEWFSETFTQLEDMIFFNFDISQLGKDSRCSVKGPVKVRDSCQSIDFGIKRMEISEGLSCDSGQEGVKRSDLNFNMLGITEGSGNCRETDHMNIEIREDYKEKDSGEKERRGRNKFIPGIETVFIIPQKRKKKNRRGI